MPVIKQLGDGSLAKRRLPDEVTEHIEVMLLFNNLTNIDERNSIYNRDTGWKILNTSENYGRTADLGVRFSL